VTTEGWPDDRVTGASDLPSVVRHCAGPAGDADRYEILGPAEGTDEGWHVLDRDAGAGDALFTLVTLRPAPRAGQDVEEHLAEQEMWRERAAGLTRVRHARLAGVVTTFRGPAPHAPGTAEADGPLWSYAVLEQASGRSVGDWLRDDPGAPVLERMTVLSTAAAVLQELHRGSDHVPPLVHGDISPRTVRLGGFWPTDGVRLAGASLGGLRRGPLHGDPASPYTAPEVRAGGLPSAASDVFGFGATAITVLTGQPPVVGHDGEPDLALVRRQLGAAPFTAPHPGMADLLLQAIATDPHERPDRLPSWMNQLRAFVDPAPVPEALAVAAAAGSHEAPRSAGAGSVVRSLPRRPVAVVVGALVLATAGAGIAIAAVQQGRLKDVPNPVAIVQPAPVTQSTDAIGVPSTREPSASAQDSASTGTGQRRGSGSARATAPRAASSSAGGDGALPGTPMPGQSLLTTGGDTPTVPPLIPPAVSDPGATSASPLPPLAPPSPPVVGVSPPTSPPVTTRPPTSPPVSSPPVTSPPVSSPPVTSPPVSSPPVSSPPVSSPPVSSPPTSPPTSPTTGPTSPSSSPTPTGTATGSPTGTPTGTPTSPAPTEPEPGTTSLPSLTTTTPPPALP